MDVMNFTEDANTAPRNPCCDCEESGLSTTCRCDDRKRYECELEKFKRNNWTIT